VPGFALLLLTAIAATAVAPARAARLVVGERVPFVLDPPRPYSTEERSEAELVWSRTLHHPGASYLAPHFSWFELPPGDYLLVRSPDGKQAWRYAGRGRAGLGRTEGGFWSSHVRGDTAILELYSRVPSGAHGFGVDGYARGLGDKEIGGADEDASTTAICGQDNSQWAKCYEESEPAIYERSRAVSRLLIDGVFACTGWLVGCEGHLMTNQHCIANASEALNTDYEFMAEGATCAASCASWGACPGLIGATEGQLVAADAGLDYALISLEPSLAETYGYLRLRQEGPLLGERIWIPQHPSHWGKRIAVTSSHAQDESGFCEVSSLTSPGCSGPLPDVGYYCDTQGGSSGSPVLGYEDGRVVALHHCANCPNRAVNIAHVIADLGPANLPACALANLAGQLAVDGALYSCTDEIAVTVQDDSLSGRGTEQVTAWSDTETEPESFTLVERSAGVFSGFVSTAVIDALGAGDGAVSAVHGDAVTIRYVDQDDGTSPGPSLLEAQVTTDCLGPVIDKVDASDVTGNAATITWDTDEVADSAVLSGGVTAQAELVLQHALRLTGLAECSTHAFAVSSRDAVGNQTTDDRGGELYTFETGKNTQPEADSTDTPRPIPDGGPGAAASTIHVSDDELVTDVNVEVTIAHTFAGDLRLSLRTPAGATIVLAEQLGGAADDFDGTVFDDEALTPIVHASAPFAGRFKPMQALHAADGIPAAGPWTLEVEDQDPGEQGTLASWRLVLTYPPRYCGAHASWGSHSTLSDQCVSGTGSGNGVWDAGELVRLVLEVTNDGSDPLTGLTAAIVPLTAGLLAAEDAATFGDLAPGASASAAEPVALVLPEELSCGQLVEFRVDLVADQGVVGSQIVRSAVGQAFPLLSFKLKEGFQNGLPASWSVLDGGADGRSWFADDVADTAGCGNLDPDPPIDGMWAAVDSDCGGPVTMDESLVSPPFGASGEGQVTLGFDHYFNRFEDEIADVDVRSSRTGGSWVNVARFMEDSANPSRVTLDVTDELAGAPDAQLRFRYHGADFDWFWYVDNVDVTVSSSFFCSMTACPQAAASPLAFPDGTDAGEAMSASRTGAGTGIAIDFDASCDPYSTNVLWGYLGGVASYELGGAVCSIDDPATWDPAPAGDLWFVLVSDNGAGVESSWGLTSDGTERNGADASGECGNIVKDTHAGCP
jgi:subtilisin-like proprotein convertase family protein